MLVRSAVERAAAAGRGADRRRHRRDGPRVGEPASLGSLHGAGGALASLLHGQVRGHGRSLSRVQEPRFDPAPQRDQARTRHLHPGAAEQHSLVHVDGQVRRSGGSRALPDQLRQLGCGARLLPVARRRSAHRGSMGVRGDGRRPIDEDTIPLGRRVSDVSQGRRRRRASRRRAPGPVQQPQQLGELHDGRGADLRSHLRRARRLRREQTRHQSASGAAARRPRRHGDRRSLARSRGRQPLRRSRRTCPRRLSPARLELLGGGLADLSGVRRRERQAARRSRCVVGERPVGRTRTPHARQSCEIPAVRCRPGPGRLPMRAAARGT